jgi:hypothetical protein
MPTYTVHAPPPRRGEEAADPARFLLVRDGFYFWAFLLAPLWLLMHRLWLAFIVYVVITGLIDAALIRVGLPTWAQVVVSLVIALLVGLEAGTLRRRKLQRRRWTMLGFVVGDGLEDAERHFFAQWTARPSTSLPPPSAGSLYAAPIGRGSPTGSDVIGLFPEPGSSR